MCCISQCKVTSLELPPTHSLLLTTHREIFHFRSLPFEQSVKLQVGLILVEEDKLGIDVLPGRVVEVVQEVADTDVSDVTAHQHKLLVIRRLQRRQAIYTVISNKTGQSIIGQQSSDFV